MSEVPQVATRDPSRSSFATVFLISALALLLQLLQTRILSVAYWHHVMYYVVTMALLGYAASGTLLFVSGKLRAMAEGPFFLLALVGFSGCAFATTQAASHPWFQTFNFRFTCGNLVPLTLIYVLMILPYLFAGMAVGGALMRFPSRTGPLYFASLLGSAAGCLAFFLLIGPVGATRLLVLACLISALSGLAWSFRKAWRWGLPWAFLLALIACQSSESVFLRVDPDAHKRYWDLFGKFRVEFSRWNPISRVDVIADAGTPGVRKILSDGDAEATFRDAATLTPGLLDSLAGSAVYGICRVPPGRVLVIGAGGGIDTQIALAHGVREINAVEINPTTAYLLTGPYADNLARMYEKPGVRLHVEDGRSFVRRDPTRYDVIMLHYTDSLAGLACGAYVLADSYIYTREALQDYLSHLSGDGILQISRWDSQEKPRECLRLFATALEACAREGIQDPLAHIMVLAEPEHAHLLMKRTPFAPEERARARELWDRAGRWILFPDGGDPAPSVREATRTYRELAEAFRLGRATEFYDRYEFDVEPVPDDRPFFYEYNRWRFMFNRQGFHEYWDKIRGTWSFVVLSMLLLQSLVLSGLLILLPLAWIRRRGAEIPPLGRPMLFFGAIGLGFMLTEIALVQKFTLFLGQPGYSLAFTLPLLLASAGLGSLCSGRLSLAGGRRLCLAAWGVAALILVLDLTIPVWTGALLAAPLPFKVAGMAALLAPLAFFMGLPFPLAIRALSDAAPRAVPFVWAVNGAASVVGSVLAIALAMRFGFSGVLWVAAACYGIAGLAGARLLSKGVGT